MIEVKTRFAPSPTGYIHIGNVRSAIYPYLVARQQHGKYILRIEDTDQARFVEGATELIEDTLKWLGLEWDEGPIVGGPHGPYFQTERKEIYLKWVRSLVVAGQAYLDNTPPETVQTYRDKCAKEKVPFLYRNFRPASADNFDDQEFTEWYHNILEGKNPKKYVVRFKADPKPRSWHDEVMGDMQAGPETQDDIVLIKADGLPTYNFAHIVDDATMDITHVIRGVEYLSSTPNYLALYEAYGIKIPKLVSLPHILAPTGNKKLGKRDGAKSVTEYRADGILPEAMLNYLANLGWNDGTEQEIYTKDDLIKKFSLDRVQTSGARYDETKLLWMNGQWIRKIATGQLTSAETDVDAGATKGGIETLYARTAGFWPEISDAFGDDYKKQVLAIIYDRLKTLQDLREMTGYFFTDPEVDMSMLTENKFLKKLSPDELKSMLEAATKKLEALEDWSEDNLQDTLNSLLTETGRKPAELFSLIRLGVSFAPFSPALNLTLAVLGKSVTMARLRRLEF